MKQTTVVALLLVTGAAVLLASIGAIMLAGEPSDSPIIAHSGDTVDTGNRIQSVQEPNPRGTNDIEPGAVLAAAIASGAVDPSKLLLNGDLEASSRGFDLGSDGLPWDQLYLENAVYHDGPLTFRGSDGQTLQITENGDLLVTGSIAVRGAPANESKTTTVVAIHCWDTDMDGAMDKSEDTNGDGFVSALDCRGYTGPQGSPGDQGPATGMRGPTGALGDDGETGARGDDGYPSLVTVHEASLAHCSFGGIEFTYGLDNGADPYDGVLDDDEVTGRAIVCDGNPGHDGYHALVQSSPVTDTSICEFGGISMEFGVDDGTPGGQARNRILDPEEVNATLTETFCNSFAVRSMVTLTARAPETTCVEGGYDIASGVDNGAGTGTKANGILEDDEITAQYHVCHGTIGPDAYNALVETSDIAPGMECSNGGTTVYSGVDSDASGTLDPTEITGTRNVCHGIDAAQALIETTLEPAGLNCANGGLLIESGLDADGSSTLDAGEVATQEYACTGDPGRGFYVELTAEPYYGTCARGGLSVQAGLDVDRSGWIDASEYTINQPICNGVEGTDGTDGTDGNDSHVTLTQTTAEAPGVNCAAGGFLLESGMDDDDSGTLEAGERTSMHYVCNGTDGIDGTDGTDGIDATDGRDGYNLHSITTAETAGANCADGGFRWQSGLDTDSSGSLEPGEITSDLYVCNGSDGTDGTNGVDGVDGTETLVKKTIEAAGLNCLNGGFLIEAGLDSDSSGILEAGEVTITEYVCHGTPGIDGTDGTDGFDSLVSLVAEPAGANCPTGGQKVLAGMDNGDGSGTANDGVLDDDEIDSTAYACTGADMDDTIWPHRRPAQPSEVNSFGSTSGAYHSVTIGPDGLPTVLYADSSDSQYRFARCEDSSCSSFTSEIVSTTSTVGGNPRIAIGGDGFAVMSHHLPGTQVSLTHCNDAACSTYSSTIIGDARTSWFQTGLAIGSDGLPITSFPQLGRFIRVVHCDDLACTSSTTTDLEPSSLGGDYSSVAIGFDGLPIISYDDSTTGGLRVAHCTNVACTAATFTTLDTATIAGTDIVIGVDGMPIIAYATNTDVKVAYCTDPACSAATISTVDTPASSAGGTDITIGAEGYPIIAYYADNEVRLARCTALDCSTAVTRSLATDSDYYPSITVGRDGLPLVMYGQNSGGVEVKAIHLANEFGIPYWNPR